MPAIPQRIALPIGAGSGISAATARALASAGPKVGLAVRNVGTLAPLETETGAVVFSSDASGPSAVARLFTKAEMRLGEPNLAIAASQNQLGDALSMLPADSSCQLLFSSRCQT